MIGFAGGPSIANGILDVMSGAAGGAAKFLPAELILGGFARSDARSVGRDRPSSWRPGPKLLRLASMRVVGVVACVARGRVAHVAAVVYPA